MARAPNGGVAMACGTAACLVLLLALAGATGARGAPAPATASNATPSPLIPLATPLGQALLATSWQAADFGPLAQAFLTQENLAYCGVASAVMALNSLGVAAPIAEGVGPYHYWSQINFFNSSATRAIMTADDVKKGGMTLAQLSALLSSHNNVSAQATHASDLPLDAFRKLLRTNVASPSDRLLVNYNRPEVGQQGGGHISPVAAYSQLTDRALVMDVARYRYPASWVAVPDLWRAALAVDSASGLSRGVVVVRAAGGGGVVAQAPVHAVVGRR